MPATVPAPALACCPRCTGPAPVGDVRCRWCGEPLREKPAATASAWMPPPVLSARPVAPAPPRPRLVDSRWIVLGVGIWLAPILTLTPWLRYVGWFLASLVHETGHTAVAWLFGCPAFPAIRLDGHAAALHQDQEPLLCWLVVAGLLTFVWRSRAQPKRLALAIGVLVLYPFVAFTRAHEGLFLLAGHLGELAFAAYAFARAMDGGFSGTTAERFAHSAVGWYLVGRTGSLAGGLLLSGTARSAYETNGSFGLENDLLRLSHDCLGTSSLAPGALFLFALAIGVASVAIVLAATALDDR